MRTSSTAPLKKYEIPPSDAYMRKSCVPESVIMEITGHSTRKMFDRYNTIDEEDTRGAINQLQDFLANVTQNVTQEYPEKKRG
jgi:hypothetical protein